jgi:hypothetical protein
MIDWICLNCGKKLEVPDERAGAEEPCPACGKPVQLPVTQVPIPSFPLPRTPDGVVAIPGDCTVGSPFDRAERQAVVDRYRRWRRRGMIMGLVPSLTVAAVLVALNVANRGNAGESVLTQVFQSVFGLACAACWGGCLGGSLGMIFCRWFATDRPQSESLTDMPANP